MSKLDAVKKVVNPATVVDAIKVIITNIMKYQSTRYAFVFMMVMAGLALPSMKSCSFLGIGASFAEAPEEIVRIDTLGVDANGVVETDTIYADSTVADTLVVSSSAETSSSSAE